MDIKDKLKFYESSQKASEKQQAIQNRPDIGQWIHQGKEVENEYGCFFLVENVFPHHHRHGNQSLQSISNVPAYTYAQVGKDDGLLSFDPLKTLYLDTETTGLAGGAGTAPFMIGVGFYTENGFTIEQYFMRDYPEERAMLKAFLSRLDAFDALATYNGKCYDVNLIVSRLILNRIKHSIQLLPHLDLLFAMRRLYKRRLSDCSLGNIESQILGFKRQDDVPGYMIPSLYFEFLRTGRGERLADIFDHNRWDILSLAAITIHAGQIYHDPTAILKDAIDWLSLGRAFESLNVSDEAIGCYLMALKSTNSSDLETEIRYWLGNAYKRMGEWSKAIAQWEYMAASEIFYINPFEELAKYYEHQIKDYQTAALWINRVLERLDVLCQLQNNVHDENDRKALLYRLNRLKRKMKHSVVTVN